MRATGFGRVVIPAFAAFVMFASLAGGVDAQTKRRKTTSKPVPVATPTPDPNDVQIISTADQMDRTYLTPADVKPAGQQTDAADAQKVKELTARVKKLEAQRTDTYEESQKRMLLNLDILTRAEQRSESLRKELFDMMEKENSIKTRLDQLEYDMTPEMINRSAAFAGSMKPEEVREMRRKSLDSERQNLQALLDEIQRTKTNLTANLQRSDDLVEKLRSKLEKDIDNTFLSDQPNQ